MAERRRPISFYEPFREFRGITDPNGPRSTLLFGVHGSEIPSVEVGEQIVDSGLFVQRGLVRVGFGDPAAIVMGERAVRANLNSNRFYVDNPGDLTLEQRTSLTFRRVQTVKRELRKTTRLLDSHTTSNPKGVPMVIAEPGEAQRIAMHFPETLQLITDGFDEVEPGGTDYWMNQQVDPLTGEQNIGICVEAGFSGDEGSRQRIEGSIEAFLNVVGHNSGVSEQFARRHVTVIDLRKARSPQGFTFAIKSGHPDFGPADKEMVMGIDGDEIVRVQDTDLGKVAGEQRAVNLIFASGKDKKQGEEAFLVGVEHPLLVPAVS